MSNIKSDRLVYYEFQGSTSDMEKSLVIFFNNLDNKYKQVNILYKISHYQNKNYGFIWFAPGSLGIANILTGKNYDGSPRVKYEPDSNWSPPRQSDIDALNEQLQNTKDWGEMADIEDKIKVLTIQPHIKIQLKPLVSHKDIKFEPGYAKAPPSGYVSNRLVAIRGPQWARTTRYQRYAHDEFKKIFIYFATDMQSRYKRMIYDPIKQKRVMKNDNYPFIDISKTGSIYITFDENTNDAAIALLMSGLSRIKNPQTLELEEYKFWYVRPN